MVTIIRNYYMGINTVIARWIMRITAIIFSLVLIILFVIASTPLNSVSIVVLWLMSFLFWVLYSGHELLIMLRVIFLYSLHKIQGKSFINSYDRQSIIDALIMFRARKINIWDGHLIPFLIYIVFSSMVFGYVNSNIFIVIGIACGLYLFHTALRIYCTRIIQYSK